ncbi:peptidylprolyl isomerase [Maribrevibacterium harenarium]|uniref:Periplasmic chaperone PpiD n=1 Tax=Maribrevibacterium harenarium TaxID=2589817 RepID=A0A501WSH0_9GAMM|nr:SurA N-terminal domain-containing protein [Maribrevibacterium harenarium]TPE51305.1 peptidylprolyl isomerase [Maribrevibacterium harenarium]
MLQDIRDKSQGIIVKVIVGFIVVTFALFGVDALVTSFNSSDTVAEVDGTEITRTQLLQAAETQRRQLISMMGSQLDPALLEENQLQLRALEELIQRTLLTNQANDLALGVSDAQVDQYLLQAEQFQTDGQFDQAKYLNFIRTLGYTPLAFKNRVKQDVLVQQLRNAVAASEFVLPSQIKQVVDLQNQQRSYEYARFILADTAEQVAVSDADLEEYFQANQDQFIRPEQVKLNYVIITADDLAGRVEVSQAELNEAYAAAIADYETEERLASHILIDTSSRTDADAQQLVAEIEQKLSQGEVFADLAETYSDDIGSKEAGGDLGYVTKGLMVPEFEQALFAMSEGEVRQVKTEYGYHLVQLREIHATQAPTLDEMTEELTAQVRADKAVKLLLDEHENITDLAYASDRLEALANEYGVGVSTTDYFGRDGGRSEVTSSAAVIAAAFSGPVLEDGHNSDLIELADDKVVVVRVAEHQPQAVQDFEQAREAVTAAVVQQKARDLIESQAQQLLAGGSDAAFTSVEAASRGQDEITALAFSMPYPVDGPTTAIKTTANGDVVALRLLDVIQPETEADADREEIYNNYLAQAMTSLLLEAQQQALESQAEIIR